MDDEFISIITQCRITEIALLVGFLVSSTLVSPNFFVNSMAPHLVQATSAPLSMPYLCTGTQLNASNICVTDPRLGPHVNRAYQSCYPQAIQYKFGDPCFDAFTDYCLQNNGALLSVTTSTCFDSGISTPSNPPPMDPKCLNPNHKYLHEHRQDRCIQAFKLGFCAEVWPNSERIDPRSGVHVDNDGPPLYTCESDPPCSNYATCTIGVNKKEPLQWNCIILDGINVCYPPGSGPTVTAACTSFFRDKACPFKAIVPGSKWDPRCEGLSGVELLLCRGMLTGSGCNPNLDPNCSGPQTCISGIDPGCIDRGYPTACNPNTDPGCSGPQTCIVGIVPGCIDRGEGTGSCDPIADPTCFRPSPNICEEAGLEGKTLQKCIDDITSGHCAQYRTIATTAAFIDCILGNAPSQLGPVNCSTMPGMIGCPNPSCDPTDIECAYRNAEDKDIDPYVSPTLQDQCRLHPDGELCTKPIFPERVQHWIDKTLELGHGLGDLWHLIESALEGGFQGPPFIIPTNCLKYNCQDPEAMNKNNSPDTPPLPPPLPPPPCTRYGPIIC